MDKNLKYDENKIFKKGFKIPLSAGHGGAKFQSQHVVGRDRQIDLYEFETNLTYIVCSTTKGREMGLLWVS